MSTRIRHLCCIHTVSQPALYGSICLFILLSHLTVVSIVYMSSSSPSHHCHSLSTHAYTFFSLKSHSPFCFQSSQHTSSSPLPFISLQTSFFVSYTCSTSNALHIFPKHTILLHIHFFHVMHTHTHTHTDPIRQISFTNVCSTESTHSCTTHMPGCETAKQSHMHTHTVLLWTIVDT